MMDDAPIRPLGVKIFLGASVAIWLPYGLYLLFEPGYLAEVAGVVATDATGKTELRAMYGGLQAAIGAMCALALARSQFTGAALFSVAFLTGGLVIARIFGLVLDGSGSEYTYGAIIFETINTLVAASLAPRYFNAPLPVPSDSQ